MDGNGFARREIARRSYQAMLFRQERFFRRRFGQQLFRLEYRHGRLSDNARLCNARIEKTIFDPAELHDVDFTGSRVERTSFNEAVMSGLIFRDAVFFRCLLHKATGGTIFRQPELSTGQFNQPDLSGSDFGDTDITMSLFMGANLGEANMRRVRADHCMFANADLSRADLSQGSFKQAIFQNATAARTCFSGAVLTHGKFTNADCRDGVFKSADCKHMDLSHADCANADFSGAGLFGANLHRTATDGANWTDADRQFAIETDKERETAENWMPPSGLADETPSP